MLKTFYLFNSASTFTLYGYVLNNNQVKYRSQVRRAGQGLEIKNSIMQSHRSLKTIMCAEFVWRKKCTHTALKE